MDALPSFLLLLLQGRLHVLFLVLPVPLLLREALQAGLDLGVLRVQNALALAEGTLRRDRHLEVLRDAFHTTFEGPFSRGYFDLLQS